MKENLPSVEELLQKIKKQEHTISLLQKKIDSIANFEFFTRETSDFICVSDLNSYFKEFNLVFINKLGYSKRELLVNSYIQYVYPEDIPKTRNALQELLNGNKTVIFENRILSKKGELITVQWTSIINPSKNLVYSIGRDITEIRKVQEKLFASESLLNDAQKIAKIGSWEFNLLNNDLIWSNELYCIFEMEKKPSNHLFDNYLKYFSEEDKEMVYSKIHACVQNKKPYEVTHKILFPDNRTKWIYGTGIPILNDKDEVVALRGVVQDITEKKRIENEILAKEKEVAVIKEKEREQESNAKFRNYVENAPDGVMVVNMEGCFIEVNPAASKITGYSKKKLLKKKLRDLTPSDSLVNIEPIFSTLFLKGTSNDSIPFIHQDGTIRDWSIDAVKLSEKQILLFVKDVTERKKAEVKLKESELFLKETQDIAQIGTYSINMYTGKWARTDLLNTIFGIDSDYDLNAESFTALVHPDWKENLELYFQDEVVNKRKPFDREYKIIRVNDKAERWVHGMGSLKWDNENKPLVVLGTIRDITEHKLLELELIKSKEKAEENEKDLYVKYIEYEEINERLKQTNRELKKATTQAEEANRAKSDFLSNMSHEIRTPLNGIVGFTDLLMKTNLEKNQLEYMSTVNISANSLMEIINDILDFSKIESGKLELHIEDIDLFRLLHQVIELFKHQANLKNIVLTLAIGENVPQFIYADSIRLKQILVNLISNALKFTSFGHIRLDVEHVKEGKKKTVIKFSIKDTGIGIKHYNQKKIFNSFVQEDSATSRKFGGTGLGLAISNLLLGLMKSSMQLKSKYGDGSDFFFFIKFKKAEPIKENFTELATHRVIKKIEKTKNLDAYRILIVEDNKINMFLAKTLVKRIIPNAVILEGRDGQEGVEQFEVNKPDLILMDIQMPIKNGYEATLEIRALKNGDKIPIIALTAGIMLGEKDKCLEFGMNDYVSKPIIEDDLDVIIHKWLP
ncbi:PAS domain S-box protein [Flavobacterium sp. 5]|uniref:PAS domain-containing hybrid sensor histidine kinase/response regulator n=1 Tax=Flavobacterium sp. 5 TaxID=2035199 RepID=UPI000CC189FC|nr:PAS domain S-box protein [Flavobacterium sp. 5]PKB17962.1 PAS domain S-box-containing protein [Flavobacterium sp. 5]